MAEMLEFQSQWEQTSGRASWTHILSLESFQVKSFRPSGFYHHPSSLQNDVLCKDCVERAVWIPLTTCFPLMVKVHSLVFTNVLDLGWFFLDSSGTKCLLLTQHHLSFCWGNLPWGPGPGPGDTANTYRSSPGKVFNHACTGFCTLLIHILWRQRTTWFPYA